MTTIPPKKKKTARKFTLSTINKLISQATTVRERRRLKLMLEKAKQKATIPKKPKQEKPKLAPLPESEIRRIEKLLEKSRRSK